MTGGADLVTLDTRIQGRIRVHTRTRGHNLWEPLDITEVWEYISKSPWCKAHSLLQTLIHYLSLFRSSRDYRNSTSSQCSDCQSPRVITSSHKTSDMHDLSMIFDQQDLFTTNGVIQRARHPTCSPLVELQWIRHHWERRLLQLSRRHQLQ